MEMKDLVKQIAAKQNKAIKDAIQYRLNEGYSLDDLEIEYDTTTTKKKNIINSTLKIEVKVIGKTDN
ncbi:hypothetical protein C7Y47_20295 [Lysinibacillus sphaericus]|uniref:Uncharacterized protein n=1 Tax=Lysinibacillus sphaericus TaxID=1421 RepID=A0A544U9F7_LYSSH|nr:hypothetical protein [Lysinibacillus sp. SDF0037]TQR28764.1 hypothetical protein C7Y47_20295 [Lysinibacillus sp. SDF0037]